jgi:hypothetical protein
MRRQRFSEWIVILVLLAACSREEPSAATVTFEPIAPATTTAPAAPAQAQTSYADAITWLKSTRGFHFVLRDGEIRAEGDLVRPTVGAERMRVRIGGEEWIAAAEPTGVVWYRGGKPAESPASASRIWQRVTIAFDPKKKEGEARLVAPDRYRFTNANSGEVHEVRVSDGRVSHVVIGETMELIITQPDAPDDVPLPR